MKLIENLIKALDNVSYARGIVCIRHNEIEEEKQELAYTGRYMDDYLAVGVLAELIKDNKVELDFKVGQEDETMKYFMRLLKGDKNE